MAANRRERRRHADNKVTITPTGSGATKTAQVTLASRSS
jgi:hypothetical protein